MGEDSDEEEISLPSDDDDDPSARDISRLSPIFEVICAVVYTLSMFCLVWSDSIACVSAEIDGDSGSLRKRKTTRVH